MKKSASQNEATLNSEEIKPVTITIIELHLSEGIIGSQSVSQIFLKFHILVEGFVVDLKTFLGLAMPNQYCLDVTK